jgi:hypothetical protein
MTSTLQGVKAGIEAAVKKRKQHVRDAAEALSDLNTFYVVISIMEGGHLHSPSYAGAERIIKICQSESEKRLREYDRAVARALNPSSIAAKVSQKEKDRA